MFQQAQTLDEFGLTDYLGDEPVDFDPLDVRLETCTRGDRFLTCVSRRG